MHLSDLVGLVERELEQVLPAATEPPATLHAAMRQAILGPGKRLRGALVLAAAGLISSDLRPALPAAVALELVHGYSLVHDDLPAMDDAATRRGHPSLHRAFGQATAILAGDALLTLAFEVLGRAAPPERALRCVTELARAAGSRGMVGGQQHDTEPGPDRPDPRVIDRLKTGRLFMAAARCGGILAGADERRLAALETQAEHLGAAYQLLDDIADQAEDLPGGRAAPLAGLGEEAARVLARHHLEEVRAVLEGLGPRAGLLVQIWQSVSDRECSP
ncbi:MAG: polyprenyl synthetase family protein [bacterium]|nr:polyprenyl synthetase family protein [bacterium]